MADNFIDTELDLGNSTTSETGGGNGRALIALAALLAIAGCAAFFTLGNSDAPTSGPVVAADQIDEPVLDDAAVASPTSAPAPRAALPPEAVIEETIIVTATTTPGSEASGTDQGSEAADSVATNNLITASVANTAKLTAYEIISVQESGTLTGKWTIIQVGKNNENNSEINGGSAVGRFVDSRAYELDSEGIWHLRPVPKRTLSEEQNLDYYTSGIDASVLTEIDRDQSSVSYAVDCPNLQPADTPNIVSEICATTELDLTLVIDLETNLLSSLRAEGAFETWPGRFQDGYSEITITKLDDLKPIAVPEIFDTTRFECVAETVGATTYLEVATLLDDNTTEQNMAAYNDCGFALFPRGKDLIDG